MPQQRKIAVVGLGYVGLPVVVAFGKLQQTIGFDQNQVRIDELKKHYDRNGDLSTDELKASQVLYTSNPNDLDAADFYIVAVPTPVDSTKHPDLALMIDASVTIGKHLKKGDVVVYESTVYPGATEEQCIPMLEKHSHLKAGVDFKVGYSPERINPGDKNHTLVNTIKIVSGQDAATLKIVSDVYSSVVSAGVFPVSSIKIAEAAKVIENTQRDLNISLINEIALILNQLGLDTHEVLRAAGTKWNFLHFEPGLVGGHCIGVDPYYLTHKAQEVGYHPDVILAGRRVNDNMGKFIAEQTIKKLIQIGVPIKRSRIAVLGLAFKENCRDIRNSRVVDVIKELQSYDTEVLVYDPDVLPQVAKDTYGIDLVKWQDIKDVDAIIITVAHDQFHKLSAQELKKILNNHGVLVDVKGILNPKDFKGSGIEFWRL